MTSLFLTLLLVSQLISLSSLPTLCFEPCDVRVRLKVEPAEDNEKVILELESKDSPYYRLSEMPYSKYQPKTVEIWYKAIPEGVYVLRATLVKHDAKTWEAGRDSVRIEVRGR